MMLVSEQKALWLRFYRKAAELDEGGRLVKCERELIAQVEAMSDEEFLAFRSLTRARTEEEYQAEFRGEKEISDGECGTGM